MEPFHIHRGFTLIELLVVLGIIGVVMSIVLTGQSTFNKTLILQNTAYDIALTLRDAQTYGLGSRAVGSAKNAGYGVHFAGAPASDFTLFVDTYPAPSEFSCHPHHDASMPDAQPGDCVYEQGQNEKVLDYALGNGVVISDFCAYPALGDPSCAVAHGGGLSSLDIVFARPNPDVFVRADGQAGYVSACVTVSSPQAQDDTRYISVAASGQIIANAAPCL